MFELIRRVTGRTVTTNPLDPQNGDMPDTYAEISRAHRDLGVAPAVTLEDGLRAQFEMDEGRRPVLTIC